MTVGVTRSPCSGPQTASSMALPIKLQEAIRRLAIVDVVLKSINGALASDCVPGLTHDPSAAGSFQTKLPSCLSIQEFDPVDGGAQRRIVFEILAGVRVLKGTREDLLAFGDEEIEAKVLATIEAVFFVFYDEKVDASGGLDEESLTLFAEENVPFNVWPYWREIVQSACGRMGLPRLVLPTHRLKRKSIPEASAGSQGSAVDPNQRMASPSGGTT
jgi:hypothetical protein